MRLCDEDTRVGRDSWPQLQYTSQHTPLAQNLPPIRIPTSVGMCAYPLDVSGLPSMGVQNFPDRAPEAKSD